MCRESLVVPQLTLKQVSFPYSMTFKSEIIMSQVMKAYFLVGPPGSLSRGPD